MKGTGTLILLSGGVDSSLLLLDALASAHWTPVEAILFDYGQPHKIELDYAMRLCRKHGVNFTHAPIYVPKSGLLNAVGPGGGIEAVDDPEVHGRNLIMLSYAISVAMTKGLCQVQIGATREDHEMFPDCRPEFIWSVDSASRYIGGPSVEAPLVGTSKSDVVARAMAHGLDIEREVWTCYYPVQGVGGLNPCGECLACKVLGQALLAQTMRPDPR
jgi:7-cyano-7-deazaguanine synthase